MSASEKPRAAHFEPTTSSNFGRPPCIYTGRRREGSMFEGSAAAGISTGRAPSRSAANQRMAGRDPKMTIAFLASPAYSTTAWSSGGEAAIQVSKDSGKRYCRGEGQVSIASSPRPSGSRATCDVFMPPGLHKQVHEPSTSISDYGSCSGSSPMPNEGSMDGGPDSMRNPRPARPSYSEEQKFFIMYMRIIMDKSWPEIEDRFTRTFGQRSTQRSKGGLTSVYYRIRKGWGLEEVLKTGSETLASDKLAVHIHAGHFSADFLASIGYLASNVQHPTELTVPFLCMHQYGSHSTAEYAMCGACDQKMQYG